MSGTGPAGAQTSLSKDGGGKGRTPVAHLLHALNQPLTGLQCSLELASVGLHTPEQYLRTLREGLELTSRMRVLVEAIRELEDGAREPADPGEWIALESLLRDTANELFPVAESRQVQLVMQCEEQIRMWGSRPKLTTLFFRLLDSVVSLAATGSAIHITTGIQQKNGHIELRWSPATHAPEHSPFSRVELGLLTATAAWKQAGGQWESERSDKTQTLTLRIHLAS
jgi:signal transduction histidine kinase